MIKKKLLAQFVFSLALIVSVEIIIHSELVGQTKDTTKALDKSSSQSNDKIQIGRVTGIGGVFFKSENPDMMKEWYKKHLGLRTDEYGTLFEFRNTDDPSQKGYLQWSPFSSKTKYFEPSKKEFMINYRVVYLESLLKALKEQGVEIIGEMETYKYGKFAHIMDPEGNKIELWEAVDTEFTRLYEGKTTH